MTPCREYRESIAAFVLGALPPGEVTPLRAHLATCDDCDRYLAPSSVTRDGVCPTCGRPVAVGQQ